MSKRISIRSLKSFDGDPQPYHHPVTLPAGELDALVEAVEAAHAYYAVEWNGEYEERFAIALARFDFSAQERP